MAEVNRHGLSRTIPPNIKREIRQACGFGCVICGAGIIDYDHIDPEFKDATEHNPALMALLCGGCHSKKTRKYLSTESVAKARANPRCLRSGFSWGALDLGNAHPEIRLGGATFRACTVPIEVKGEAVVRIEAPEELNAPFRLSALFTDSKGAPVLRISDNEWEATSDAWDVRYEGGRIEICSQDRSQRLKLRSLPPHGIAVDEMHMLVHGYTFIGSPETLEAIMPDGSRMSLVGALMDGCSVGLALG